MTNGNGTHVVIADETKIGTDAGREATGSQVRIHPSPDAPGRPARAIERHPQSAGDARHNQAERERNQERPSYGGHECFRRTNHPSGPRLAPSRASRIASWRRPEALVQGPAWRSKHLRPAPRIRSPRRRPRRRRGRRGFLVLSCKSPVKTDGVNPESRDRSSGSATWRRRGP